MPPVAAERWFHTLVVVGAALAGCGGETAKTGMPATSGSGGVASAGSSGAGGPSSAGTAGGALASPRDCAYAAEFVCDDYPTRTNCRCDTAAPHQMGDCASPLDFRCTRIPIPCEETPSNLCFGDESVGCRCDTTGLRPSDCATPEQFYCSFEPGFFTDCQCSPDDSTSSCGSSGICCQSDNPRFGCNCCPTPIK